MGWDMPGHSHHMSTVAVHGSTMSAPPLYETQHIIVNVLGSPEELEFKSKVRSNLVSEDAYEWNFGDGTPSVIDGYVVTHTFEPGTFVVALNVNTTEGVISDEVEITVPSNGHLQTHEAATEEETSIAA